MSKPKRTQAERDLMNERMRLLRVHLNDVRQKLHDADVALSCANAYVFALVGELEKS